MRPLTHLILGIFLAVTIFVVYPSVNVLGLAIIVLSSVLIDIDHYFYYIYKRKNINPIKAYKWYTTNRKKCCSLAKEQKAQVHFGTYCLHGIEILIILLLLGFFASNLFYFILIGFTFHLLLDLSVEIVYYNVYNKVSVIYAFLKSKGLTFIDDL